MCLCLGGLLLCLFIFLIFNNVAFKNLFKKQGLYKRMKFGFYECGFRTRQQYSSEFSFFNYLLISLTIIYDIECVFLLILLLNISIFSKLCFLFFFFYILLFFLGILIDVGRHTLDWQYL